jgi:pimeloyl-ACP methyl ester carboxylesterase
MKLPVGYFKFHKDPFINFQLNRWHSLGYARKEDLEEAAPKIRSFGDYTSQFVQLAEQAVAQDRLKNAAFYYRAAEFLVPPDDKEKLPLYDKFQELFYRAFADEQIERHEVPYAGSCLSAILLRSRRVDSRGTIVAFGGFDSFIEEFYALWAFFAEAGYDVVAFEGPGQGAALRKYGLAFDHNWEAPTAAVLDHFDLSDVTLIGISMGGYWCIRAAAFEKRVRRVISFPPVYGWLEMAGPFNRGLVHQLMKTRWLMNFLVRIKMKNGKIKHAISQALFLTQKEQPIEAVDWLLGMNKDHLHSELVDQDVLLLGGENDAFQPPVLLRKQQQALVNARSVTTRIFTKAEHADQHCQMGNLGLALDVMLGWLKETENVNA